MAPAHRLRSWQHWALLVGLVAIVSTGAAIKWPFVPRLITHVDDIGVVNTLRQAERGLPLDSLERRMRDLHGRGPVALASRALAAVGATRLLRQLTIDVTVPLNWTYAPAQYFLTGALVSASQDYATSIRRGRMPSWFFACLAPLLVAWLTWRTLTRDDAPDGDEARVGLACFAAALTAGSAELSIHSAQMENYALAVVAAALLLLLLARGASRPAAPRAALLEGTALAILCWSQYQVIFALPAWCVVRVMQWRRLGASWQDVTRGMLWAALPLTTANVALYHYFLGRVPGGGVAWNAGPHGEYLFSPPAGALAALGYVARFFVGNVLSTVTAITAFLDDTHRAVRPIGLGILMLSLLGLWRASRLSPATRDLARYLLALMMTWSVLIVTGTLTLGPTRHALVWLPALSWLAALGLGALVQEGRRALLGGGLLAAVVMGGAASGAPAVLATRTNPVAEASLVALVDSIAPDLVVAYECTEDLSLMPSLRAPFYEKSCSQSPRDGGFRNPLPTGGDPRRVLFVSTAEPMSAAQFRFLRHSLDVVARRPVLDGPDSVWIPRVVRDFRHDGSTEWRRGIIPGAAGLFVTLYSRGARP